MAGSAELDLSRFDAAPSSQRGTWASKVKGLSSRELNAYGADYRSR